MYIPGLDKRMVMILGEMIKLTKQIIFNLSMQCPRITHADDMKYIIILVLLIE